ncbi:Beta-hexosaminidase [Acidisarcina polymorpha]|uniref:beta-N-acetylhexosaminidase n=1 Tax=Acidisarcina polymorpha TaxID=2211140 RepID=A0A2Z5G724_9BACT|nr:beta-N-acetylhexosaminidase [Acidisarcina polymorpha]AXC15052.1 Beta-hexosaminidase [Acidisarcina polymorpha]
MIAIRKQVGQLLIVGLEGAVLTASERGWLKILDPGGVILFRRNIETVEQTLRLLEEASSVASTVLFRCVDLEGGLVDRLRDLLAPMPSAAAVGAAKKRSAAVKHGKLIGREAKMLGFNTVFAPVLDLGLEESRTVMRTRTVSADPEEVAAYADGFLSGLEQCEIVGCGKHFPGLGGGTLDSHQATPVIERSGETLWKNDLFPFRKLKARMPLVMVSHACYPAAGEQKPASISRYWITDVLTKRMGYRGLILSDDLEMGGVLSASSIEEASIQSVLAGTHLIEICKEPSLIFRAYEALLSEAERSTVFRRMVEAASRKISRAKRRLLSAAAVKPPSQLQMRAMVADVNAFRAKYPEP